MKLKMLIHTFNKIRRYIGYNNAFSVFVNLHIIKTGKIKLNFLKHPLFLRVSNSADYSTFNEVILRDEYNLNLGFQPLSIIDCGANIGLTTIVFANRYPEAIIVSIEPEEANFNLLKVNTKYYPNIQVKKSAVWSKNVNLEITDKKSPSNAFSVKEVDSNCSEIVNSITIPEIMKEFNWEWIDLLKIDIEGAEKELFTNGYAQWLPYSRVVIVETHDRFVKGSSKTIFKTISQYNFSCKIKGHNFIFTNEDFKLN